MVLMASSLILALFFFLPVAAAAAGEHLITKKVGEDVTFSLGSRELKPDDGLLWSCKNNDEELVLFNIENDVGKPQFGRFKVDLRSGSLTIKGLLANDSAVYRGQIFNGNGTTQLFNLTVKESDLIHPIQPTAEPQQAATWIIPVVVGGVVVVLICTGVLLFLKWRRRNPGVLERWLRRIVEPRIQEEQCGFRPVRGTLEQL